MELMLYHSNSGANSLSALIYMEEKRIRYGARSVDGGLPNHLDNGCASGNPSGLPLLANQTTLITGPTHISRYVEELVPDRRLQPNCTLGQKHMLHWLERIENELAPVLDDAAHMLLAERLRRDHWPSSAAWPRHTTLGEALSPLLRDMEAALQRSPWLAGERYSLADIHAFPLIARFARLLPEFSDRQAWPHTLAWLEAVSVRPAVNRVVSFLEDRSVAPGSVSIH